MATLVMTAIVLEPSALGVEATSRSAYEAATKV